MAIGDAHVFPGFLTPVLTQLFFPKPPTTILTCFCRDERRKYAGKKSRLHRGSNSKPPDHESDTLTTEPAGRGGKILNLGLSKFQWSNSFPHFFSIRLQILTWFLACKSHHDLQIEFDFRYAPSIFCEITDLGLSKFQWSNSFLHFFPKHLDILSWFLACKSIIMTYRSS